MDADKLRKYIQQAAGDRTKLIDNLLAELEKGVSGVQKELLRRFVSEWVDKLDVDPTTGKVKNTMRNKRLLSDVDNVFTNYVQADGVAVAEIMVKGVKQVIDFNGKYFKDIMKGVDLVPINKTVVSFVESWLGIKGNGLLQGNGYLSKTVSDPKVLGELKNFALRAVVGQQGYESMKVAVKGFIDGNQNEAGLLQRYYRNFVYDTYSQVDRASAGIYAQKLKMDYAIYEGGLIKTSRKFCKQHNGKLFTREEINNFDPKVAIPPNYNPETDLGGYGCRHHLNWVPESVAFALRPDLQSNE